MPRGAPPVDRGAGPNSGPAWRESVGWKILLPLVGSLSSSLGLRGSGDRAEIRSEVLLECLLQE